MLTPEREAAIRHDYRLLLAAAAELGPDLDRSVFTAGALVALDLLSELDRLREVLTHPTTMVALRAAYKAPSQLGLDNGADGWRLYKAACDIKLMAAGS